MLRTNPFSLRDICLDRVFPFLSAEAEVSRLWQKVLQGVTVLLAA